MMRKMPLGHNRGHPMDITMLTLVLVPVIFPIISQWVPQYDGRGSNLYAHYLAPRTHVIPTMHQPSNKDIQGDRGMCSEIRDFGFL